MSAQGCVIDVREHHGIVYRDVKVWSDKHGEPIFGFYTVIDGRLYDVGSSADFMEEYDCQLPVSPVVHVPCTEMNAFLASYFDVPCDYPVLCAGDQIEDIIKLKAGVGYVWCADWEDFVPVTATLGQYVKPQGKLTLGTCMTVLETGFIDQCSTGQYDQSVHLDLRGLL